MKWGLFTKWRRSGSAGLFRTLMHAGCVAGCAQPRKAHLVRAAFCPFCLNTLRVLLADYLCVGLFEELLKNEPQITLTGGVTLTVGILQRCGHLVNSPSIADENLCNTIVCIDVCSVYHLSLRHVTSANLAIIVHVQPASLSFSLPPSFSTSRKTTSIYQYVSEKQS